eukprot:scaffold24.g2988.t1
MRITVAGQPVAWMLRFKYLGGMSGMFSTDGGLAEEAACRMQRASYAFERLRAVVWQQRAVPLDTKLQVHNLLRHGDGAPTLLDTYTSDLSLIPSSKVPHDSNYNSRRNLLVLAADNGAWNAFFP